MLGKENQSIIVRDLNSSASLDQQPTPLMRWHSQTTREDAWSSLPVSTPAFGSQVSEDVTINSAMANSSAVATCTVSGQGSQPIEKESVT